MTSDREACNRCQDGFSVRVIEKEVLVLFRDLSERRNIGFMGH